MQFIQCESDGGATLMVWPAAVTAIRELSDDDAAPTCAVYFGDELTFRVRMSAHALASRVEIARSDNERVRHD